MFATWRPCLIYLLKYIFLIFKQYHTFFYTFFTYTNFYAYFLFLVFKCTFFPSFYSFFCVWSFPYPKPKVEALSLTHYTSSMSLLPSNLVPLRLQTLHHPPNPNRGLPYPIPRLPYSRSQTPSIICAKRTGKQRYPSEKKKLKQKQKQTLTLTPVDNKFEGVWRLSKLGVPIHSDPGKDFLGVSPGLLQEIAKVIEFPVMFLFGCWESVGK